VSLREAANHECPRKDTNDGTGNRKGTRSEDEDENEDEDDGKEKGDRDTLRGFYPSSRPVLGKTEGFSFSTRPVTRPMPYAAVQSDLETPAHTPDPD